MAEIDSLEIKLQANAQSANKSLSALIGKLDTLSTSLSKVSGNNLTSLSNGVQRLSSAMQSMKSVGTADFTRLSKNLEKLGSMDAAAIGRAASSMHRFTNALQSLDSVNVSDNVAQIGTLAKGISQLGYKSATQAIDNIPRLAVAMKQLMNTLSTAPKVSQNLVDMTNALANLSRTGTASGRVANSLSTSLNTYTKSADKAKKKTFSLASAMGSFYANFALVLRGINKAWDAAEKAMDYVETYNYYDVTLDKIGKEFGDNFERFGADSAEEYAKSFSNRLEELTTKMTGYTIGNNGELFDSGSIGLGLDPNEIMSFQAKIGAITNSVGMLGENSINTAKVLSMLSADMSSLTNTDLSTVMTNLQSGIIGQSRALYKYGIDITNATLQTYAYQYGISKAVSEMTQAEKMQLRLIAILDQSRVAWGDQANTINTAANQYRVLKQQISNLGRTIGNLFLPIITKVLPYVNAFIIVLNKLFTTLGFKLFGDNWLTDITKGINGGTGLDDFSEDVEDVADGLDDATGAAKKFKNQLQGFDELNVLTSSESSTGAGSTYGGLVDLTDAIADMLAEYESVWEKALADAENKAGKIAESIINAFKNAYKSDGWKGVGKLISDWLTNALNSIDWESIYQGAKDFAKGLAEFLNGLITPDLFGAVGRTIAGALNTAIYAALSFGETFDWKNLGNSLAEGLTEFFETTDTSALAETINVWIKGALTAATTFFKETDFELIGTKIGEFLEGIDWTGILSQVGELIWEAINAGIKLWSNSFDEAPFETVIGTAGLLSFKLFGLKGTIGLLTGALKGTGSGSLAGSLGEASTAMFGTADASWKLLDGIKPLISLLGDLAAGAAGVAVGFGIAEAGTDAFYSYLEDLDGNIRFNGVQLDYLQTEYDGVSGKLKQAGDSLTGFWMGLQGLPNAIAGVYGHGDALEQAFADIAKGSIYTDEQMKKMQETWAFTEEDMESLRQEMLLTNPELRTVADAFGLFDASAETLKDVATGIQQISDGSLTAAQAAEEFKKPMWDMTGEAQKFFDELATGKIKLEEYQLSMLGSAGYSQEFVNSLNNAFTGMEGFNSNATAAGLNAGLALSQGLEDSTSSIGATIGALGIKIATEGAGVQKQASVLGGFTITGFINGITKNMSATTKPLNDWSAMIVKTIHDGSLKFGSPSKTTEEFGLNTILGFNNGITKNISRTIQVVNSFINTVKGNFSKIISIMGDIGTQAMDAFIKGFKSGQSEFEKTISDMSKSLEKSLEAIGNKLSQTSLSTSNINVTASVSGKAIPAYATGGFPEDGLFYANRNELVGQFSNGRTAVANNEQITEGIYTAVRDANYETNVLLRSLIQAVKDGSDITIVANDREIGKVVQRQNRIYKKSTGRGMFDD